MVLSEFLALFSEVRTAGGGWLAACPAHADGHPSLAIDLTTDTTGAPALLVHCRAGCTKEAVLAALGLQARDLFRVTVDLADVALKSGGPVGEPPVGAIAALAGYVQATNARLADVLGHHDRWEQAARQYALDRFGLDSTTALALGLGVDPGGLTYPLEYLSDTYRAAPRLVVPFRDFQGVIRGLQARDLTGQHRVRWCGLTNPEGAAWSRVAVFTLHTGMDMILLTEGPGDALTAVGAGLDAIAIRGAALGNAATIRGLVPYLTDRQVVLAGDADQAGRDFNAHLGEALEAEGIHTRVLDLEGPDLTAWREQDPDRFQVALDAALGQSTRTGPGVAPAAPGDDERLTDLGNAERLRESLGNLVRYAPEAGFYLWTGTHWHLDRLQAVRTAAQDVTRTMVADAEAAQEAATRAGDSAGADRAKRLAAWGRRSQSSRALDAMLSELEALPGVALDVERLDAHPHLLAFANGTVDLRTGALRPTDPALLITKALPFAYDPDAPATRWEQFLAEVFAGSRDLPAYVRRLVGYGITGLTSEQCFAVLWGKGANGKSVFTDTLAQVFRPITVTTPFSTFEAKPSGGIPNDLAGLKGARVVLASEGEQGRAMAESVIKRVTGSDLIAARFMRREFFEFRPTFLIFLATNHKPSFRGQDEGLWRRVKLIPWARYFRPEERDHYLGQTLAAESAGIAAWAVRGAVEWYANGLQDPPEVTNATADYRETSDELAGFFPGVLVLDPGQKVLGSEVMEHYQTWADEEGILRRWERRTLFAALEERGLTRHKGNRGVVFHGVRLSVPADWAEVAPPPAPRATPTEATTVSVGDLF